MWKTSLVSCVTLLALGAGIWTGTRVLADKPAAKPDKPAVKPDKPVVKPGEDKKPAGGKPEKKPGEKVKFDLSGAVAEIGADGKSITIMIPPKNKGDEPTKQVVKIDDKTGIVYGSVGPDGAKLTVGYKAAVRLVEGSTDKAAQVILHGDSLKDRASDIKATVASVAADGKSITVVLPPKMKGDEGEQKTYKLPASEQIRFSGVHTGKAQPAAEQAASIWFKKGSTEDVERIVFFGSGAGKGKGETAGHDHFGKVVTVSADGKTITLEAAGKTKGEAPKKVEVKIDDKTDALFDDVGTGEAKPTVGQTARVWMTTSTSDTAARISFNGASPASKAGPLSGTLIEGDAKKLEVEVMIKVKGKEPETTKHSITLTPETRVIYQNVGPNGARMTKGYQAQVWLASGSKDKAAMVVLQPAVTK
jgi:hypothetical protein